MLITPIFYFLIIFCLQFKYKNAKKILIVAPNRYTSHFNFHKSMALSLVNEEWVDNVVSY